MNYLGHAVLSFGDKDILTGNMIGDYVKGMAPVEVYPENIQKGILLHRKIDEYADNHPASLRAQVWFREKYGRYSGAIVDTLFDHFLATDPHYFQTEPELLSFTQDVYNKLESNQQHFPQKFAMFFPYMKEQNWLYNYRSMQGIHRSLQGLQRRAKYMSGIDEAYNTFITYYYQISQCYYEYIEHADKFVKHELRS